MTRAVLHWTGLIIMVSPLLWFSWLFVSAFVDIRVPSTTTCIAGGAVLALAFVGISSRIGLGRLLRGLFTIVAIICAITTMLFCFCLVAAVVLGKR